MLRRGGGRGLGREALQDWLDFEPTAFAVASSGNILVTASGFIHMFDIKGKAVTSRVALPGPDTASYMECFNNCLIFTAADKMYTLDIDSFDRGHVKTLVSHVKPSGGLALFPTANKLLFISVHNSLCELDMESQECRVITESISLAGRLCSGTEKLALFISPTSTGSMHTYLMPCSMSTSGSMSTYGNPQHSALNADFCVNSSGDVLFFEQPGKGKLASLRKLPGLLPT
ncbi:hypothetical protein HaLaN_07090, partial [Haematococcus lacustris]